MFVYADAVFRQIHASDIWAPTSRLCVRVSPFCFSFFLLHYILFYFLFIFFTSCSLLSLIYNGEREAGDKRGEWRRQSERSHSVMLSATHNALQVDAWHVLYIFPLWRSLNKCPLIYSSQEMNFYLCGLGTCSRSQSLPPRWSLGPMEKHTHAYIHIYTQTHTYS